MNTFLKLALVAAAVVVVGIVGVSLLPRSAVPGVGTAPTAAPTATPTASPVSVLPPDGEFIEPGRYRIGNLSIDVPEGWTSMGSDILRTTNGEAAAIFAVFIILRLAAISSSSARTVSISRRFRRSVNSSHCCAITVPVRRTVAACHMCGLEQ